MRRSESISIIITVILIGIPSAAEFYPPLFSGIANQLPLEFIFTWMARTGILILGIIIGWFLRGHEQNDLGVNVLGGGNSEKDNCEKIREIEGCIEVEGICWRGTAKLSEEGISETELMNEAICPDCQTVMSHVDGSLSGFPLDCPRCDYYTFPEHKGYDDAKNLFNSHIRRIVESEGEDYSLDNIIEKIEGEATPRQIWEQYANVVDDSQVSLNCFH